MAKEGSTVSGLMDSFATTVSVALQYGVPLKDLVNKFAHVRFEPSGFTGNQEIPIAKSIVDYIFRWLGSRFLPDDDKANLGLIDRSAVVADVPVSSSPGAAAVDLAETGGLSGGSATAADVRDGGGADLPTATDDDEAEGRRRRRRVAPEVEAEAPKAELAVVATNGHTNGHAANGNGNGAAAAPITLNLGGTKVSFQTQADAPSCADCGSIMVRNGVCYKCLNCGSTSGCS